MSKVFLRMEQSGGCRNKNGLCYFSDDAFCTAPDEYMARCRREKIAYIQDTIIPQQLALYEEMLQRLCVYREVFRDDNYAKYAMECRDIIDRAKEISEVDDETK